MERPADSRSAACCPIAAPRQKQNSALRSASAPCPACGPACLRRSPALLTSPAHQPCSVRRVGLCRCGWAPWLPCSAPSFMRPSMQPPTSNQASGAGCCTAPPTRQPAPPAAASGQAAAASCGSHAALSHKAASAASRCTYQPLRQGWRQRLAAAAPADGGRPLSLPPPPAAQVAHAIVTTWYP